MLTRIAGWLLVAFASALTSTGAASAGLTPRCGCLAASGSAAGSKQSQGRYLSLVRIVPGGAQVFCVYRESLTRVLLGRTMRHRVGGLVCYFC